MLKVERHQLIMETLEEDGRLIVADLVERFDVSEMTIRRDLSDLEQQGLLRRVHGGAVRDLGRNYEPPYQLRANKNQQAKQLIARKAAEMIVDGDSIALDTGTSTLEIVHNLTGTANLTIITHSMTIANEVINSLVLDSDVRLILAGGIVRSGELSMIGHIPLATYQEFNIDKAFVGIAGLSLREGLTEFSLEDALVKRAMLDRAREAILLADGSKFGCVAFASVCSLDCVDSIVTDASAPADMVFELRQSGVQVVIADEV